MPLHDHFREPLASRRHFTALHSAWATYLAEGLSELLPEGYFVEPNVHFAIEIDVATWDETATSPPSGSVAPRAWTPPAPALTVPLTLVTDVFEVQIVRNEGGPVLAGAVELVSPANKDRPASRDAFVSKCATYLQQGVGLAIVDIVTERSADLHRELLARLSPGNEGAAANLFAAAYRAAGQNGTGKLDVWHERLAVGSPLPTLPLWLRAGPCLPLRLEAAYERAVRMMRLPVNGA